MKEKNLSIELLKFFAVLIVLNSHMDVLYGNYSFLATGGAFGDALFFFVSGFTIFLGRFGRFDNWYKRRIKRIYPSLIAWALVLSFLGIRHVAVYQIITGGRYWFISCIMLYYVVLWFVRRFAEHKPLAPFILCCIGVIFWYSLFDKSSMAMYGNNYLKWLFFFLFMLAGAYVGNGTIKIKTKLWFDGVMLVLSVVLFYGIQFVSKKYPSLEWMYLLSLVPLMCVTLYGYKICCNKRAVSLMNKKVGWTIRLISGLCLEVYIVQLSLIPLLAKSFGSMFPFNIFIASIVVIVVAYLIRCLGRIFSQVFEKEDMDWKKVFELVS